MVAHGTLLDAHLLALLDAHGSGKLMGKQLHEGQRADAGALGLLLLFTTQHGNDMKMPLSIPPTLYKIYG